MPRLPMARAGWRIARGALSPAAGVPLARAFRPLAPSARCAGLRLLDRRDAADWTRAQRAMAERMTPWWSGGDSWQASTDETSFHQHLIRTRLAHRRGTGLVLAVTDEDDRLIGELLHWNMTPGGDYAELGMWSLPHRGMRGMIATHFARCFDEWGMARFDAPVEVGNRNPVGMLTFAGFVEEGLLSRWRPARGGRADFRMFGLTRPRWDASAAARWVASDLHPPATG